MSEPESPDSSAEDLEQKEFESRVGTAYGTASGLLMSDLRFLAPFYLLLILPDLLSSIFQLSESYSLGLEVLKRCLYLFFVYLISNRWASRLSSSGLSFEPKGLLMMFVFGFGFWALFAIPIAFFVIAPSELKFLFFVLFIPAAHVALRYYFYFFPVAMNLKSPKDVFRFARAITERDKFLALRALISPFAIMFLLVALLSMISPDGRMAWVTHIAAAAGGIYGVLATYLALAFFIVLLDEPTWRSWELDPYRGSRLSTLAVQGKDWLATVLRPKAGMLFLGMAILIWSGNEMRASTTPPAPNIRVEKIRIEGKQVIVDLQLFDDQYQFRGFHPGFFHLGGESGTPISSHAQEIFVNGEFRENFLSLPTGQSEVFLTLEFETERSSKDLTGLEDLYLWYRKVKVHLLDMSSAKVVEAA